MQEVSIIEELYLKAIQHPDPIQRAAYLDSACANDPNLRRKVEELLNAHAQVGEFLEPQPQSTQVYLPHGQAQTKEGVLIGNRYKLLEKIGEGGMGEVWVADQTDPIKRRVALKLIKPGMDSRSVLARFEAERQTLAVMDHPNIAKVLDAGTTGDGRPYFVMELVKGTPITELADARKLTPTERLALFVPVCQAIQHAHMKGIIHRDIKPSNVLVELHDDRLVPKVIDFGVAKAVGQQLTEKTIYTGFGALVGTPTYMAPEQATFNTIDIDTRADVYALGVVLYELLAGSPPIESERLKKAALDEVLRIVRDEEPPRPSQRLSTSETKASIAVTRGSEPMKLSQLMRGELDWIVMKALEKDRTRRYESANGFAADIQRYLAGEQVQAVPPSLGYRLKKVYKRNRPAALIGTAFTTLIVGAAIVSGVLAIQAREAETLAEAKRIEAEEQRREAERLFATNSALTEVYLDAAAAAEIRSNSSRLDADLLEYRSDSRIGLLKLARPLTDALGPIEMGFPLPKSMYWVSFEDDPELQKLREFQAAAVIAAGQEFVPLVPPIDESSYCDSVSPDGRQYILTTEQTGLKLLELPSLAVRGILREASERLVKWGFSPDSQTVWTQDTDSVLRFWNTDGTFRAKTPVRADRFIYPAGITVDNLRTSILRQPPNDVLVADGVAVCQTEYPDWEWELDYSGQPTWMRPKNGSVLRKGPVDLYSSRTGNFIRRLDRADWTISNLKVVASGRWIVYQEHILGEADQVVDSAFVIVSANDGRELARLDHPGVEQWLDVSVSPTGKWLISFRHDPTSDENKHRLEQIRLWRSSDWKIIDNETLQEASERIKAGSGSPAFITDDVFTVQLTPYSDGNDIAFDLRRKEAWTHYSQLGHSMPFNELTMSELGGTLIRFQRLLTDANTLQRLKPPPGRRYASELVQLAPDGRFFENLDTVSEKELPFFRDGTFFQGLGVVAIRSYADELDGNRGVDLTELRIIPDPSKLTIPPAMLELWAKVVTGGELAADGGFEAWDESTWQAKQRELSAMKPPYKDFPFPGWVATEPHLWWRIKAYMTQNNEERNKLLDEWLRRSGRLRPEPEPDTWRTPGPVKASDESRPPTSEGSSVPDAPTSLP